MNSHQQVEIAEKEWLYGHISIKVSMMFTSYVIKWHLIKFHDRYGMLGTLEISDMTENTKSELWESVKFSEWSNDSPEAPATEAIGV